MNAPLPEAIRKALKASRSTTNTALTDGRAFMSGVQALVRLPMLQRQRDLAAGLNTGGFVSGYRGSRWRLRPGAVAAKKHLAANHIVFQPGVNEELGATAVWGTQQLDLYPRQEEVRRRVRHLVRQGPGRGPLLRRLQARQHGRHQPNGGVIAIAGDDHVAKSSTAAHQSDHIFEPAACRCSSRRACRTSSTWACTPSR